MLHFLILPITIAVAAGTAQGATADRVRDAVERTYPHGITAHDAAELGRAAKPGVALIGVNNLNLKTPAVDLAVSEALAPAIPADAMPVCESGLNTPEDLGRMAQAGFGCFLIGESLMRQDDVTAATRALTA